MSDSAAYDQYTTAADLYDGVPQYRERTDVVVLCRCGDSCGKSDSRNRLRHGTRPHPDCPRWCRHRGLDASPKMLAVCRERLQSESAEVQSRALLVEADMRTFDLGRTFTLITIPFRPFQHLITVQDQCACLRTIRRHLMDTGRLILDLFNPSLDALSGWKKERNSATSRNSPSRPVVRRTNRRAPPVCQ